MPSHNNTPTVNLQGKAINSTFAMVIKDFKVQQEQMIECLDYILQKRAECAEIEVALAVLCKSPLIPALYEAQKAYTKTSQVNSSFEIDKF